MTAGFEVYLYTNFALANATQGLGLYSVATLKPVQRALDANPPQISTSSRGGFGVSSSFLRNTGVKKQEYLSM